MGGADIATDGMAAPAEALGEGAIELHNAARSAEEAGKALNAVAEEKHMKSASDEFLLYRPTKNKRTMRPFDDSALPINLHPANGKPTDFYKLFEPLPPKASHPMPIGRTRPEFYLTEDATGYTSNFMGTGNPGIMLQGGHGGMLSGMVNMNLDAEGEREHCTGEAEAILQHLSSQHRLELWDSNKPLHLAACHIGGQRDTIAELSSSMQRPVITYGSGRIAFHNGFKDALSFQKTEIAEVISDNHYVLLEETWHPVDRLI